MNARIANRTGARAARQSGFSLMEIIIVIVLIGAVAAFAANRIMGGSDRAKWNLAESQISTLAAKIENYELDNGAPPEQLEDLVRQPGNASGWLGPYAKESELRDPWNKPFEYRVPGENGAFDLISYGKDGRPGGDSYNRDISNH